ncbi:MAG: CRISPR-associated protein Cas4 [candidate division WOR-3 bacterium]|nr:CRISPR-associated protein Cas4 [candidate division WOR-3 bacterium]
MSDRFESGCLFADTETTPMLTPSEIIEHIFCPRYTYFMHCLKIPQKEEQRYIVMKGRQLHNQREKRNPEYLRKRIGCVKKELNVYLASPKIRVRGVVDEVLTLADGSMAPLDYKYTQYREWIFKTHRYQSVLYGMLISEIYSKPVRRGYICYVRTGAKLCEVIYKPQDYDYISRIIEEIFRIIKTGEYPSGTRYSAQCVDCCYRNICV